MGSNNARGGGFGRGFLVGSLLSLIVASVLAIAFPIAGELIIAPSKAPDVAVDVPVVRSEVGAETSGVDTVTEEMAETPEPAPAVVPEPAAAPETTSEADPVLPETEAPAAPEVEAQADPATTTAPELEGFSADVETPTEETAQAAPERSAASDLQAAELNAMLESPDVSIEPMVSLEPVGSDMGGDLEAVAAEAALSMQPMIPLEESIEPMIDPSAEADTFIADPGSDIAIEGLANNSTENMTEEEIAAAAAAVMAEDVAREQAAAAEALPEPDPATADPAATDPAAADPAADPATDPAADPAADPSATDPADPAATDPAATEPALDAEGNPVAPDAPKPTGALAENSVEWQGKTNLPVLSVILIDQGEETGIEIARLAELGLPLSIGIRSDSADAAGRAQAYRDAGFEVVAIAPQAGVGAFRRGQNAADLPVQLEAIFGAVPGAIAVMDPPGGELPKDNQLVRAVLAQLKLSGAALLTQAGGFNSVDELAREAEVPSATVVREIDKADSANFALSRAALQASKTGSAIIMANTDEAMVKAVVEWLLSPSARSVEVAPTSAAILAE